MAEARRAALGDRACLLQLLQAKTYPPSWLRGVTAERRREHDMTALEQQFELWVNHPQVSPLLSSGAFMIAVHNQEDFATGQPETVVVEHGGDRKQYAALLPLLVERARAAGDEFLALRVHSGEEGLAELLQTLGWAAEFARVVRALEAPLSVSEAAGLRRAGNEDRGFLARLHLHCSPFYESSQRRNSQWATVGALDNYLSLDLSAESSLLGWVAEEQGTPRGYVLVKLGFEGELLAGPSAYLYDIAVDPQARGRSLAGALHEAAVGELLSRGVENLVGDISAHNHQALAIATRRLGYGVEWQRWGLNL